jgi:hypothetical protein
MEILIISGLSILTLILVFWAIIDITKSRFKKPILRTIWLMVVLFFPILGSLFYFQLRKKLITKEPRKFQPTLKES